MNRKFRCGRLISTKEGRIKKLELEDGGGTRFCNWDTIDMDFKCVHDRLLDIFNLDKNKCRNSLYDFQRHPLDINQYKTFSEYINKNGLNYIGSNNSSMIMSTKTKKISTDTISSPSNSFNSESKISLISKDNSSVISNGNKQITIVEEERDPEESYQSLGAYSFEKSNNDLINNIRIFITQTGLDEILLQLLKNSCIIYGFVRAIIDPLKQHLSDLDEYFSLINESEIKLYSDCLNNVFSICQTMKTLIELHKKKYDHLRQFSIIVNLFSQFHKNLKILSNRWFDYVEKNNKTSTLITSSFILSAESISFHSNIKSSPKDHYETNTEISTEQLQTSFSSSSRVSSIQQSSDDTKARSFKKFRQLLSRLTHLLDILQDHNFLSCYRTAKSVLCELKPIRLNMNSMTSDEILKAKTQILLTRKKFKTGLQEFKLKHSEHQRSQQIIHFYKGILNSFGCVFETINLYQPSNNNSKKQKQSKHNSSMKCTEKESKYASTRSNNETSNESFSSTTH
ncbi:unnamed protein product [Rotaria sp. Silwood2]|nr:unnamed protein product [Rotaria sp. Silwood2]CAF3390445.1 unnamed protein product [Rotaria sp. Silwood2]CAF4042176.1 unnamed protein product [Rotaria sp. Silwood2]CAF4190439.1 unnamed protein product [Rotaria sp. Silwood2]